MASLLSVVVAAAACAGLAAGSPASTSAAKPGAVAQGGLVCELLCPRSRTVCPPSWTVCPPSRTVSTTATVTATVTATSTKCSSGARLPPLACVPDAFLVQRKTLLRVGLRDGRSRVVAEGVGGAGPDVDSLGFNPLDGYLYGVQGRWLLRIGADGSSEPVAELGPGTHDMGDIDGNGQFFVGSGAAAWVQVDLEPESPTYGQVVARGSSTVDGFPPPADWAFTSAFWGYLYSLSADAQGLPTLARWSTAAHEWDMVHRYAAPIPGVKAFGAIVATSDGILYAADNASGLVVRIPLEDPEEISTAFYAPLSDVNDGARCPLLPDE